MDYEITEEGKEMPPENKNWNSDICTIYASWGNHYEGTLRSLLKQNFPDAHTLSDIATEKKGPEVTQRAHQHDKSIQTTERIYTFPTPMPSPLAKESVRWGEEEIKPAATGTGELWHARLGHTNDSNLKATSETYPMFNIPKKHVTNEKLQSTICECCAKCKATLKRKIKSSKSARATRYLERVHMDVCGPLQMKTYDGCQYFTVFLDEYTKYRWIYVHKDRTTSVEILKKWIQEATRGTENTIGCLRTDQAGEHLSKQYQQELMKHGPNGIRLECSASYDHFQNGHAERLIRYISNMARCMLEYGGVARDMWGYAVRYAAYVQNRIVHAGQQMSPFEARYGTPADLSRLKVFGCMAYVTRDKKETDYVADKKLDPRSVSGCFVGMADDGDNGVHIKGHMVWTLETGARLLTSSQVTFDETRYPKLMGVTEWEFSMRTKIRKCKATVTVMNFDTEDIDKHPFTFEDDEIRYREQQENTRLNPQNLVGSKVTIEYKGKKREGRVYNYLKTHKLWGIVLCQAAEDDPPLVYITTSQMANDHRIKFHEKIVKRKNPNDQDERDINTSVNLIRLQDEIQMLKYDQATRDTQSLIDKVVHARVVKTAPISRHEPEPKTWRQAMNSPNLDKWYNASKEEIDGLDKMKTWEVVRPRNGIIPIDSKWVYKIKYTPSGAVEKYKARLVVRGDSQRAGLDFGEVFSPVAHNTICRMLLSMATACDFEVDLVDVCQAFLNAPLEEEIYMRPAPGVTDILGIASDSWLKLKRNLYGLRQAPRNWSLTFINWMLKEQKYVKASIDDCLFYKEFKHKGKDVFILLLMYVDDNIIISNDRESLDIFKKDMHEKFKIVDKGPIETYLGVQIQRDRNAGTLKIHQEGYLNEVLAAMSIKRDNPLTYNTPLPVGIHLVKNEGTAYELDLYRSAIGSLIYLSQWTRIDIAYAVSALAAHMANPSRDHHVALKHVLHYLHGTRDKGITYHKNDEHGINKLYGFVDADYAGEIEKRRSRTGYVMMMNSGCISWKSKLQTVVANSTTDAEVYAATLAIKEVVYLRDALRRIGLPQATVDAPTKGTLLYEDNEATTAIARSAAHREATKHMAIARSFLRYHHENGTVSIQDCYTNMQVADFLTKPLGAQVHDRLVNEAMGKEAKIDIFRFARRDWRALYDEKIALKQKEMIDHDSDSECIQVDKIYLDSDSEHVNDTTTSSADVQGGMLKCMFVDTIYMNVMRVDTAYEGPNYLVCDDIEEYLRFEQHRSSVVQRIQEEELSVENRYYGEMISLQRVTVE